MLERTHDLAAITALTTTLAITPAFPMTLGTAGLALLASQIGSAVPDLDQPSAEFYRELPAISFVGKIIAPLLGGHRFMSHSILGIGIIGYLAKLLLGYLGTFISVDMTVVWWAFILGYFSHLLGDTLTKEGVPWLFPIPIRFGFPPFRFLRIETGKFIEKVVIYPALILTNIYLVYTNYPHFVEIFSKITTR